MKGQVKNTIQIASRPAMDADFRPHACFRGGHLQTLAGFYPPDRQATLPARQHRLDLDDGDALVLHESRLPHWRPHDPVVLLVHGLAGCHGSSYMRRIGHKLSQQGYCVIRMDQRGCGAGTHLATRTTHCGRTEDIAASLVWTASNYPDSPTLLVGFSLGGAITLNLLGELGFSSCGNLERALAICPPIDLPANADFFRTPLARPYDRFFVKLLWQQMKNRDYLKRHLSGEDVFRKPVSLRAFDALVTAPLGGFDSVDDYYVKCSPGPKLSQIRIPTTILTSADDPVICIEFAGRYPVSSDVRMITTKSGGHLGFFGRKNGDPDRRWLDWRVVDWVAGG